jgi:hypothetical protein
LIDFQAGKRQLTGFEDRTIKFSIRNELRDLELARVQYPISVAQAALAAEQVTSIRLSLSLGIANVRIPDLLDVLDNSHDALINVANARIGYIVQRSRFALELEQMQLDGSGFWPEIYDKDYQSRPRLTYPNGAGMTYGGVPEFLRVSDSIRRMNCQAGPCSTLRMLTGTLCRTRSRLPYPTQIRACVARTSSPCHGLLPSRQILFPQ